MLSWTFEVPSILEYFECDINVATPRAIQKQTSYTDKNTFPSVQRLQRTFNIPSLLTAQIPVDFQKKNSSQPSQDIATKRGNLVSAIKEFDRCQSGKDNENRHNRTWRALVQRPDGESVKKGRNSVMAGSLRSYNRRKVSHERAIKGNEA